MVHAHLRLPSVFIFSLSMILGVFLAAVFHRYRVSDILPSQLEIPHSLSYMRWLQSINISFPSLDDDKSKMTISETGFLKNKVRVLCFVMPQYKDPSSLLAYFGSSSEGGPSFDAASAIVKTWGRRCNKLVFFGHSPRVRPPGVSVLPIKNGAARSWNALREALVQVAVSYQDSYDWFLKVDLETYVIVENLRYYLAVFDAARPHYFGHVYETWDSQYNAGEAGLVLSRGALRKLHNAFIKGLCEGDSSLGDVGLGRCLADIGISPADTRDSRGRGRFLALDLEDHLVLKDSLWRSSYWKKSRYKIGEGPQCCSDFAVTFHAQANTIYVLEYLVYHLKPFGISAPLVPLH